MDSESNVIFSPRTKARAWLVTCLSSWDDTENGKEIEENSSPKCLQENVPSELNIKCENHKNYINFFAELQIQKKIRKLINQYINNLEN